MSEDVRPTHVRPRHRMVDRVATILELVARSADGLSLTEIAREADAPLSSAQGLVNGLVATGYLDEHGRRYRLGVAPYVLNLLAGRGAVNRITHADLERVHAETGLTVVLSVVVGPDVVYIDHCSTEPGHDLADPATAYLAESYARRSAVRTSSGWVMLADFQQRDLWSYLRRLPQEDAGRVDRFLAELPRLRKDGLCSLPAVADAPGTDGISVAVREHGRTVAAVAVVGPRALLEPREDSIVQTLRTHAEEWQQRR